MTRGIIKRSELEAHREDLLTLARRAWKQERPSLSDHAIADSVALVRGGFDVAVDLLVRLHKLEVK